MQISSSTPRRQTARMAAKPAQQEVSSTPQESFTLSQKGGSHFSGGKVAMRVLGGAATGLGAHYFTGGDTMATAKLGAAINGTAGAVMGGVVGGVGGAAAGAPLGGALLGAAVGGGIGAVGGGIKGALIAVAGNAFGGGPIAFAGAGAALGLLGL